MPPDTTPTKRVRILVAIDERGKYVAYEIKVSAELTKDDMDMGHLGHTIRYSIIEADVPMPLEQPETVIEGTVKDAEG